MTVGKTGRRQVLRGSLLASLAALTGCRPGQDTAVIPGPAPTPAKGPLDADDVAAAERLAGVSYTVAERQMIVDTIESQLATLEARRTFVPDNEVAPAMVFDPRLPGFLPPKVAKIGARLGEKGESKLPKDDVDIAYASVASLGRWLREGALTSRRLTEIYLGRLERLGPKLECVVTLTPELALAQADRADAELKAGKVRGPLHGIPWGAKDLLDTAGIQTSWGAATHEGRTPDRDAVVVQRLHEAGAVLVAKLSLGAIAFGDRWYGGQTKNPWNVAEGSSGSSAGSGSAVAAGLVGFALGTETMGSIISPSMRNGVCGLRPSFGRVGRSGAMALCWSLDKIGPLARRAEDCAAVLAAINGGDEHDPSSFDVPFGYDGTAHEPSSLAGVRIGMDPEWFEGKSEADAIETSVVGRLRALGATVVELSLPELPYEGLAPILTAEAAACFEDLTLEDRDDLLTWQGPHAWPNTWRMARFIPAVDLVQAQRLRRRVQEAMRETFETHDVVAMVSPSFSPLLAITNYAGYPSLTLRAGFVQSAPRGLFGQPLEGEPQRVPHGITLYGRLMDEASLVRIGRALEQALGVWDARPPIG